MSSTHYFLGIHIPEVLAARMHLQQNKLKEFLDYKLWTGLDDFHITLKFLGGVEDEGLSDLIAAFEKASDQESFDCLLEGLGFFGKPDAPRVLMQRVQKTTDLIAVHHAFEKAAESCGFPKENRSYAPHVTLAKKFVSAKEPVNEIMNHAETKLGSFTCMEVVLFRIEPKQVPRYIPVAKFALKGGEKGGTAH